MRILFVTPYVPSLIRVRPLNFIKQLAKRHAVTLVTLLQGDKGEEAALAELVPLCEAVHTLRIRKVGSLVSCCRRLLTPVPLQAAYTYLPEGIRLVRSLIEGGGFDMVHVEHIRGAHFADGLPVARVFDSVDCITRLLEQRVAGKESPIARAISREELAKMRAYEAQIAAGFNGVVITSEQDRHALAQLMRSFASSSADRRELRRMMEVRQDLRMGYSPITVVANGVDCDYFSKGSGTEKPANIVFSGKMSYFANVSAVTCFYREVFPLVRHAHPDATFTVVGSDPPESVRRLALDPAVEVTGYVPDIRPYLASAAVVVCPLTVGVGIQNKVLEAMAMAKPIVTSPVACKGIPEAMDGRHIMRAESPEEVAGSINDLLQNRGLREHLGENARRLAVDSYSWETAAHKLEDAYAQAISAHKRAGFCAA